VFCSFQQVLSHNKLAGNWEGVFMSQFSTQLTLSCDSLNNYGGSIKMFAGENLIQDDPIEQINLSNNKLTFYIPAKETTFQGNFNDQMIELSGNFIFPDASIHAIQLKKTVEQAGSVEKFRDQKEQSYRIDQLISDINFLYAGLKKYHPQLYAYISKDSMNRAFEEITHKLDSPTTLEGFYLLASEFTNNVHCSHTGVRLPVAYQNLVNDSGNYFPFNLYFTRKSAFFISGRSEDNLPIQPGNEIISINNVSTEEIISRLFHLIPSEGYNTTTKYNTLNKRFHDLFYYTDDAKVFTVEYQAGDSIKRMTVPACRKKDLSRNYWLSKENDTVDYAYMYKGATGVLKISSFAIDDMDLYLEKLDTVFKEIRSKNVHDLVLDLRDNEGGHPIYAAQLFSYLTDKDFVYFKRNEDVTEFEPLYNTMHANENNFKGNLYVFINGGCLSTTGHLISLLKHYSNPIFIGEEPGSTFRCNDFSQQLICPNTGIEINVPRTTFQTAVTGFSIDAPFLPDYEVENTIVRILNKEDGYFEVLAMIKKQKDNSASGME
jgi:C-terminal processing protease CtpA/Prc